MYLVNKIISILLIISFLFSHWPLNEECPKCPQCVECVEKECEPCEECPETCEGTCYTDEEVINIEAFIQQLEVDKEFCIKTRDNMQIELNQWYVQDSTYQALIKDMEQTIELRDKLIKEVTPKWWENKWLWFGLGVVGMGTLNSLVD